MLVFPTRTRRSALVALLSLLVVAALPGVASAKVLKKPTWLSKVAVTEYYPAPEWWFVGAQVQTPGLARKSRIDWLYSARGVSMEGDGHRPRRPQVPHRSRSARAAGSPSAGAVRSSAAAASSRRSGALRATGRAPAAPSPSRSTPAAGTPARARSTSRPTNITFADGPSRPLRFYRSVAVDPALIPLGSLVYVPAYKPLNKDGWFRADDTGGAIKGRHIDVYRRPPDSPSDSGRYLQDRRIFVVPEEDVATYVRTARMSAGALPAIPRRLLRAPAR